MLGEANTRWRDEFEAARKARGLSQEAIAKALQVHLATVRNWSQGHTKPGLEMAVRVAGVLQVAPIRVLDWIGLVPGLADLVLYVDQLQEHVRLTEQGNWQIRSDGLRGIGYVTEALAENGQYQFKVVPWKKGRGSYRRHFADWIAIQPLDNQKTRMLVQKEIMSALRFAGAYWNEQQDWRQHLETTREDLVLIIQRFHAQRRSSGSPYLGAPRSIAVLGQHWCGHTEIARFLSDILDYDFVCAGLAAASVYGKLPNEMGDPSWVRARAELTRTYAMDAELGRQRVWAADIWDDIDLLKLASAPYHLPYVVYLRPTDNTIKYAGRWRSICRESPLSETGDVDQMKEVRSAADEYLRHLLGPPGGRHLTMDVDLPDELRKWQDADMGRAAEDPWFDHYAKLATALSSHFLSSDSSQLRALLARAGMTQ